MLNGARGPRPTLEGVAAHAGVSRATVSRVINGSAGVRAEVREQVKRSVAALGYVPNSAARSLVTRRTGAVAVVIAEPETRVFSDPFFAQQLRGISRELALRDIQLVLLLLERRSDYARIGRYLAGGHVDGALMFSLHTDDPLPAMATESGLPTVFGGRPGWPGSDQEPEPLYVDTDNRGGARQAVEHLLERGRRRIAVITGPLDQTSALDRLEGYHDALANVRASDAALANTEASDAVLANANTSHTAPSSNGADPALIAHGGFTAEGGERAMAQLLDRRPDLDAVFAGSDLMASGAIRALRASGRRIPEDVAVVGYDDLEPAAWADPPLTTVRQDVEEMGTMMAQLLMRRLDTATGSDPGSRSGSGSGERADAGADGPLAAVVTPARLIVRNSS